MGNINLFNVTGDKRIDDLNIVKSWLCNSTDGETYSITDTILDFDVDEILKKGYSYEFPEVAFDDILGFKHDYRIDDPNLTETATKILDGLYGLNEDIKADPGKYFKTRDGKSGFVCKAHKGVFCDYCVGEANECLYTDECPFKGVC